MVGGSIWGFLPGAGFLEGDFDSVDAFVTVISPSQGIIEHRNLGYRNYEDHFRYVYFYFLFYFIILLMIRFIIISFSLFLFSKINFSNLLFIVFFVEV